MAVNRFGSISNEVPEVGGTCMQFAQSYLVGGGVSSGAGRRGSHEQASHFRLCRYVF